MESVFRSLNFAVLGIFFLSLVTECCLGMGTNLSWDTEIFAGSFAVSGKHQKEESKLVS